MNKKHHGECEFGTIHHLRCCWSWHVSPLVRGNCLEIDQGKLF